MPVGSYAHRALAHQEPACHVELPEFQGGSMEPVRVELWRRYNDSDDIPPAWRCESCRQTSLVDGVVPRSACRGFCEPHFSAKF